MLDRSRADDETLTALTEVLPPRQIVELLLVIGKQLALPAILHNELSTAPDVHALAFPLIALILMGLGLGLGALGSGITLRRFLKV